MRIYSATDVGQKRKMNQDYVFATADPVGNLPNLFVVADGMGGHNAGDYASSHAVTSMVEEIRQDADFNPVKVIRHAIECVNTEILAQAQQDEKLRGMGTTIVAATIVGHYAYVANVGDSRLYVIGEIGITILEIISPVSRPSPICWIVTPDTFSPSITACWIGAAPLYFGRRDA